MNNPPLPCYLAMGLLIISRALDVPFFYIFKLPQLLSDVGTALLLAKISKKIGSSNSELLIIAIFSISPVGILMTGYHGNTDSLCQFGIVGSVFAFVLNSFFLSGLLLAFSINIKLIPVLMIPFFFFGIRTWSERMIFLSGVAVGNLPLVVYLLIDRQAFVNILGYTSLVEPWGIWIAASLLLPDAWISRRLGGMIF